MKILQRPSLTSKITDIERTYEPHTFVQVLWIENWFLAHVFTSHITDFGLETRRFKTGVAPESSGFQWSSNQRCKIVATRAFILFWALHHLNRILPFLVNHSGRCSVYRKYKASVRFWPEAKSRKVVKIIDTNSSCSIALPEVITPTSPRIFAFFRLPSGLYSV